MEAGNRESPCLGLIHRAAFRMDADRRNDRQTADVRFELQPLATVIGSELNRIDDSVSAVL